MKLRNIFAVGVLLLVTGVAGRVQAWPAGGPMADLAITNTASASAVTVGQQVQFFLTLSNLGPMSVSIPIASSDLVPSGFQFVNSSGNGSYNPTNGQWSVIPGAVGNAVSLTITLVAVAPGVYTNTALGDLGGVQDPNPTNNISKAVVTVTQAHADLAISTGVDTQAAQVGDQVIFTVSLTNNGPDAVTFPVTISNTLSANLSLVGFSGDGAYDTGSGIWTVTPGAPGNVVMFSLRIQIIAEGNADLTAAIANLPPGYTDSNSGNDLAHSAVSVGMPMEADLALFKYASTNLVKVGQQMTFYLELLNEGPDLAPTNDLVKVYDPLPAGFRYVSSAGDGVYTNGSWLVGFARTNFPAIAITVEAMVAGGWTNTATIISNLPPPFIDPNPTNDTASAIVGVISPVADLALFKYASTNLVKAGQLMTFYLELLNEGPDVPPTNVLVEVYDPLPAGFQYFSSVGDGVYDPNASTWVVGFARTNFPAIAITVEAMVAGGWTNRATIISNLPPPFIDPNPTNDTASAIVGVTNPQADLGLFKYASTNLVKVGQQMTFYLELLNEGPDVPPTNDLVKVYDPLPAGFRYVSSVGDGVYTNGSWLVGFARTNFPAIAITVEATAAGGWTNTATIISNLPPPFVDPNPTNDTASVYVTVTNPQDDLEVAKYASTGSLKVGQQMTFYLQLFELGPDVAPTNVLVNVFDPLPAGFRYLSSAGDGMYNTNTGSWLVGFARTNSPSIAITGLATTVGGWTNTATIVSNLPPPFVDPNPANDAASVLVTVNHPLSVRAISAGNLGLLSFSWPANLGVELQESPDLTLGTWANVTSSVTITNEENQVMISPTNGMRFYRLGSP